MKTKTLLSVHVDKRTRDQFKASVKNQGKGMSEIVEQAMRTYIDQHSVDARSQRVQLDQATEILARAVCNLLSQNPRWATEAIIDAGMGLPGSAVFDKRTGHFSLEKQMCGQEFARWLIRRITHFLSSGKKVFLVCDSGTTVFWFLKAMGEAISEHFSSNGKGSQRTRTPSIPVSKLSGLTIITNNIPGAEAFVTYASQHALAASSEQVRMSDLVDCRLLAGVLLPEYVALTGSDTNDDLGALHTRAKKGRPSSVFIGVATGNWLSIETFEGTPLPHLLARGRGHGPFKEKLLQVCDETFVLAPLGKIFMKPVGVLNARLGYSRKAPESQKRSYEVVPVPSRKGRAIKLVSTYRNEKRSILEPHSFHVREAIEKFANSSEDRQKQVSLPIDRVGNLLFEFDRFSNEPTETQVEIELPHQQTRTPEFKKEFFSIR